MVVDIKKIKTALGMFYYTQKRFLSWRFGKEKFARALNQSCLPHLAFSHRTPLLRQLKDVDMWMQHNKVINLKLAVQNLNGIIVQPGETLSFWRLVGRPSSRKGYVKGMVLVNGQVETGVGGGLCQLSNLIYWITLHTPLKVVERYRHNFDVFPDSDRAVPFGSGATCYFNYIDLKIFNGTDQPFQLKVYLSEEELVGEWLAVHKPVYHYEVYQKDHWITHEYRLGYLRHNTIYRRVYHTTEGLIGDEYLTENHALMMYQPYLSDPAASR